jgi:hypothetical protein
MEIRKIIQRKIERHQRGLDLQADVNAVVAANVGEGGQTTRVSSHQTASSQSGAAGREGEEPTPRRKRHG